jgi:hypothetical protein
MNAFATPETNAFVDSLNDDFDVEFAKLTSHACKLERERDQLRAAMGLIAEDCTAWLHAENDLPAVDFVKAVRDYATTYSLQTSDE